MSDWPWDELGIEKTRDVKAIRSAYSTKLKALDLDKQIEEYSSLRQARGFALHLATMPEEEEQEDDYGLGDPLYEDSDEDGGVPLHYESDAALEQSVGDQSIDPIADQDLAYNDVGPEPEPDPELQKINEKFNALSRIILPNGEQSDDAFSLEEYEEAELLLREILDLASNATLDTHQGLDYHLSEVLARGWPRSAALVEAANTEFNWFAEVGQITERPALVFLNARLAGMRFNEEVEAPDHRLHKAWNDLAHGGPPVWLKRNWLSRDKVLELINFIRVQHPELEALLDPGRVQAWEGATTSLFARVIQGFAILWFLGSALRFCAGDQPPSAGNVIEEDRQAVEAVYRDVVVDILGDQWTSLELELASPLLARAFERAAQINRGLDGKPSVASASDEARHTARLVLMDKRDTLSFDEQVRAYQLQLTWLTQARAEGKPQCKAMLNGVDYTPKLSPQVDGTATYEEEKALFNALLEIGDPILENQFSEPRSASIPGWVIGEIIDKTKLSQEQVSEGLSQGDSEYRCDVIIALMETVARAPSRVDVDVLAIP